MQRNNHFYAAETAIGPHDGYRFRVKGAGLNDWRGYLYRFTKRRLRDAWVNASQGRQVIYNGHYTCNFAEYIIHTTVNGGWERTGDEFNSEVFRMKKNVHWPS